MSFIRKSVEPPEIGEGEILEADILDAKWPVEGKYNQQVQLRLRLQNGYTFKTWIPYYNEPADRSSLGQLCMTLMKMLRIEYHTLDDALNALKEYSRVYVRCAGFRDWRNSKFPKFKVVVDRLPPLQETLKTEALKQPTTLTLTLEEAEKIKELLGKK